MEYTNCQTKCAVVFTLSEITEREDELLTPISSILCFSVMSEIAPGTSIPELPLCFLEAVIKPSLEVLSDIPLKTSDNGTVMIQSSTVT